jgi:hypothetical protein
MALKINKAVTSLSSAVVGNIPSGAIVKFITIFAEDGASCRFNLKIYESQAAHDAKKTCISIVEIPQLVYVHALAPADYTTLTPAIVHTILQGILEAIPSIGAGQTSIV